MLVKLSLTVAVVNADLASVLYDVELVKYFSPFFVKSLTVDESVVFFASCNTYGNLE
jgi:hypothetical protein